MAARKKMIETIIKNSIADRFEEAALEWDVTKCTTGDGECICGQKHLQYLFTIRNRKNGIELYPVGSECIKKFNNEHAIETAMRMQELLAIAEKLKALQSKTKKQVPDGIGFQVFSRKLLKFMYLNGAFPANRFNRYNGYNDYEFALGTFNGRYRNDAQRKKEYMLMKQTIGWVYEYAQALTA